MKNKRAYRSVFYFLFAVLAMLPVGSALSQSVKATLYGTVIDANGAVIPGATTRLANQGTGASFESTADGSGGFAYTALPDGVYTLTIESPGFKQYRQAGLTLSAGAVVRQNFSLTIGEVTETVEVTSDAPLVNAVNAEQRTNISDTQVQELPLPRRDWTNLVGLGAGMQSSGGSVRMNGLPGSAMRLTVDGTDATQDTEAPSFTMSGNFNIIKGVSMEAVKEVNIAKGIASAEIANTMSGNVNITTKGGTNELHGSLFWLNNLENYNARNQFLQNRPNSVFNQFGASLGGPVIRNKLFLFGVYEGYRLRGFSALSGNVPTPEFKQRIAQLNPIYNKTLSLFPDPNQSYAPTSNTGLWLGAGTEQSNDDHGVLRGDWNATDSTLVSARYTRGRPTRLQPRVVAANNRTWDGATEQGTFNVTHARPTWTFESRVGVNYNRVPRRDGIYDLYLTDPSYNGISGLGFGLDGEALDREGMSYSFEELVTTTRGRHTMKFGGIYMQNSAFRTNAETPILTYTSFDDLVSNIPNRGRVTMGIDEFRLRTSTWGGFFQDDFKVNRNLVINLGVRYDYFTVPKERDNRLFNRDQPFGTGPYVNPRSIYRGDFNNFSPRVGFAYSFGDNAKTVLRGGWGMFHNPIPVFGGPIDLVRNAVDEPFRVEYNRAEALQYSQFLWPVLNSEVSTLVKGSQALDGGTVMDTGTRNPFSYQWLMTVQHQLTDSLAIETGYTGTRGVNMMMTRAWNQVDRVTGLRPYAGFTEFTYRDRGESTAFHSWQTTLRKRFSHGLQFNLNYTYANSYSYTGQADLLLPGSVQDIYNIRGDKGLPDSDIRHVANLDFVYELPFFRTADSPMLLRNVLGGWQVSGILSTRTGSPFNLGQSTGLSGSRPDYIGGEVLLDNYRDTLQYFNPSAFDLVPINPTSGVTVRPGNLGRNALRGPGMWNLDASASKRFYAGERIAIKFDAQFLNSLNHTNFNNPQTSINAPNTFGRITSTRGARQIQFGLRMTF